MGKTTLRWAALLGMSLLGGCGGSGGSTASDPPPLDGAAPPVTVTFKSYCSEQVAVYQTDPSGSACTPVDCVFRTKPDSDSGRCRTPIPEHVGQ
ncbi:MAG: hypothetical protein FJ148_19875 [Deltaproteobacteria bacterium]|nr:hypothetical protein [Deltaproteobacteria bacterium]